MLDRQRILAELHELLPELAAVIITALIGAAFGGLVGAIVGGVVGALLVAAFRVIWPSPALKASERRVQELEAKVAELSKPESSGERIRRIEAEDAFRR